MADAPPFLGEEFELPDRFNSRRLLRFAAFASTGIDDSDPVVLAEVDKMLDQVVRKEDAARFDDLCDREGPSIEELLEFTMTRVAILADRPTVRSSASRQKLEFTITRSACAHSCSRLWK